MSFDQTDTFGNELGPLESIAKITDAEGVAEVKTIDGQTFVGPIGVDRDWITINPELGTCIVRISAVVSVEWLSVS